MKKVVKIILIILLIFIVYISFKLDIRYGINKNFIVADAKIKCNIDSSWSVIQQNDYDMYVLLFYSPDKSEGVTVVYSKMPGSFGYFFKGREILFSDEVDAQVMEFYLEKGARAYGYSSINNPHTISKIEEYDIYGIDQEDVFEQGNLKNTVIIKENEPFLYIMSENMNMVIFYDLEGNIIEPRKIVYK